MAPLAPAWASTPAALVARATLALGATAIWAITMLGSTAEEIADQIVHDGVEVDLGGVLDRREDRAEAVEQLVDGLGDRVLERVRGSARAPRRPGR